MKDSQGYAGRRTFYNCGAVAGALIFGPALIGVLVEARGLWREGGATVLLSDAGMRLFFGACLGILTAAPYLLLARASRKTGPPILFVVAAISMLAFQMLFTIYILFFARSSTASIALMFMPLYLCVAVGAIWVVAALAREAWLRRSLK
jgi:hypothetical protein